jgi:two-component system cell cycle sensor histidine kinase/response regulator CckA
LSPAAAAVSESGSGIILLVEDDDNVREVTTGMLTFLGYDVIEKRNPAEAIAFCSTDAEIDLILADLIMPEMNGREMVKRIEAGRPGISVLYMSGYSAEITTAQGILETGVHFLRKPFDIQSLNKEVLSIIKPR